MNPRLLIPLFLAGLQAPLHAGTPDQSQTPSLELLEYLAEFGEDSQGHLIDPMEQDTAANDAGSPDRAPTQKGTDR